MNNLSELPKKQKREQEVATPCSLSIYYIFFLIL